MNDKTVNFKIVIDTNFSFKKLTVKTKTKPIGF